MCRSLPHDQSGAKKWTVDQDQMLRDAITKVGGAKHWKLVASMVPGRSGVQCRQRWERLKPGRVRGKWSPEEDLALMSAISSVELLQVNQRRRTKSGLVEPCWSQVAAHLPARTAKQCRYRWLVAQKKNDRGKPERPPNHKAAHSSVT